jgi:hypothetical protein
VLGFADNQSMMLRLIGLVIASVVGLAACSPTFNWREAHWSQDTALTVMLPCKPDLASRPMRVGDQTLTMRMMGCEAGGALFAVAVVSVIDTPHAIEVQRQWQQAMLGNMQADVSPSRLKQEGLVFRGASEQPHPMRIQAQGKRHNGQALSAQALWFARGGQLYHAAIYAEQLDAEVAQTFFEGLRFP